MAGIIAEIGETLKALMYIMPKINVSDEIQREAAGLMAYVYADGAVLCL